MTTREPAPASRTRPDAPVATGPAAVPTPANRLERLLALVEVAEGALDVEAEIAIQEDAVRIADMTALTQVAAVLAAQWDALDLPVIPVRTRRAILRRRGVFRKRIDVEHVVEYPDVRVLLAARSQRPSGIPSTWAALVVGLRRDGVVVVAMAPAVRDWDVRQNDRVVALQSAPTVEACHRLDGVAALLTTRLDDARPFHTWDPAALGIEPAQVLEACRLTLARRLAALEARQAATRAVR